MAPIEARRAVMSNQEWLRLWMQAAAIGTLLLAVFFGAYEVAERYLLRPRLPLERLLDLHAGRGIAASVLVGSSAVYVVWRARRRFDEAFSRAYQELEAAMTARSRELVQAQAFSERLFDALRDRITVVDGSGVVVKANRVALEASRGRTIVGRPCAMLDGACTPSSEGCTAMKAHRLGLPVIGECVRSDPRTGRIYSIDAYPVPDLDGSGSLVIESAHDITRSKQLEAHVRYQEKLAALGVLAAGIAHDIANPLASMSSELEMIEGERDLTRVRESVGVLRSQVSRMARTLREMTDFARRRGDDVAPVAVSVAIEDALRLVRHDPRARRVQFVVEAARDLPPLHIVEDHLVMVIVNLVINAFDAMPDGGRITLRAKRDVGGLSLAVIDTGTGMSSEVLRRAAEPLFTTKGGSRGTGLGLSVCVDVLRGAGATLAIDSSPGHGTTVLLQFGAREVRAPDPLEHAYG